jgi:hypothetical protein
MAQVCLHNFIVVAELPEKTIKAVCGYCGETTTVRRAPPREVCHSKNSDCPKCEPAEWCNRPKGHKGKCSFSQKHSDYMPFLPKGLDTRGFTMLRGKYELLESSNQV